jgi:hypothetical protein
MGKQGRLLMKIIECIWHVEMIAKVLSFIQKALAFPRLIIDMDRGNLAAVLRRQTRLEDEKP